MLLLEWQPWKKEAPNTEAEWVGESGRQGLRLEGAVKLCPMMIRLCTATTYISS